MTLDDGGNVRVLKATDSLAAVDATFQRNRTQAQKILDQVLDTAESKLLTALEQIDEALDLFSVVTTPVHRNLGVLVNQQIEQVREYRRAKL